jgi:hypothetical protein
MEYKTFWSLHLCAKPKAHTAVEEVTGRKATTVVEFATDHADAFR